ncbi:MAG: hypothetical protein WCH34_02230 [Bacteroidota bacterium]
MPSNDFVPHKNNVFQGWQEIFVNMANENMNNFDLTDSALEKWTENTIL